MELLGQGAKEEPRILLVNGVMKARSHIRTQNSVSEWNYEGKMSQMNLELC